MQQTYERTQTICALIDEQVQAHPQRTAVFDGETEIDYARLSARASAIAAELATRGVPPGSLVGICLHRSWELVATLVGVLRAGCAYVPLDPEYPQERVRYMLQHARAAVAVVDGERTAALCDGVPRIVRLDAVTECTPGTLPLPLSRDLAYVIYTSGSTGRPKGVAVEHRNVVAMVQAMRGLLDDHDLAGVLAAASVCFDPSVMELLGTLSLGGTVVLADNVLALPELSSAQRVRTAIMVPSSMQALLATGWRAEGIRCAVLGGEVLKPTLVAQLHALPSRPRVLNVYGPTEDTVFSTAVEIAPGAEAITIGKPVTNSRCYILDASLRPLPVGTAGELYLAGDKLARGYLYDESRNQERFVDIDPDGPIPETRLYRTGDRCRWREDGEIEFIGRIDQQVKLRGFRIELEEVESALASIPGVDSAAAAVIDAGAGKQMLVGYIASGAAAVTGEAARAHLAQRLPKYMVPQRVLRLDALPRLPNGKLDRGRLSAAEEGGHRDNGETIAAASAAVDSNIATEQPADLARLPAEARRAVLLLIVRREIARVLGLNDPEDVPPPHAIEAMGLDSLDAVELSHRLATALNHKLPASLVSEHPTADAITDYLVDLMERGTASRHPATKAHGDTEDALGRFQADIRSGHPPFLAAKAPAWSATDKGTLVREFKRLLSRQGRDPYGKFLRTGSAHAGIVADAHSGEEREAIIWTTNLYLGLNRDREVVAEARDALDRFGTGMGTSATASGVTGLHLAFEEAFAELTGKPAACLFPTGFTANLGVIAGLLGDKDVVVMDQLCHASIVDGARLCGAKIRTFRHNDAADLDAILRAEASPYRTALVVLEGVYSMGEGTAPVREIVHTAKRHGALVLVDEAHSFGFYGPRGAGLCAEQGVSDDVDFIMTTLSKALGSLGGVIAAREEHVALLKSSARAYVFQATSTPADIAAALAALRRLSTDDALRGRLWDTTAYMRRRFSEAGYDLGSGDGPIVTPHFSDSDKLYAIARGLNVRGIHTAAVTYPIVERGRGRLRFICSASHTRDHVDRTLAALVEAEREVDERRQAQAGHEGGCGDGGPQTDASDAGRGGADRMNRMSMHSASDSGHACLGRSELEAWAQTFGAYLRATLTSAPGQMPSLAVAIELANNAGPVSIRIDARDIAIGHHETTDLALPRCSLRLCNDRSVAALSAFDVQALLDSVLAGTCVLNGRVEPFVWLVARMAERQLGERPECRRRADAEAA